MKARKVKGLDPAGALADNAERIVHVRLGELWSFVPAALGDEPVEEPQVLDAAADAEADGADAASAPGGAVDAVVVAAAELADDVPPDGSDGRAAP